MACSRVSWELYFIQSGDVMILLWSVFMNILLISFKVLISIYECFVCAVFVKYILPMTIFVFPGTSVFLVPKDPPVGKHNR